MQTLWKWQNAKLKGSDYEAYFISKSNEFKKYTSNMYILNRACLRIQHAFFKSLALKRNEKLEEIVQINIADCKVEGLIEEESSPAKKERRSWKTRVNNSCEKPKVEKKEITKSFVTC